MKRKVQWRVIAKNPVPLFQRMVAFVLGVVVAVAVAFGEVPEMAVVVDGAFASFVCVVFVVFVVAGVPGGYGDADTVAAAGAQGSDSEQQGEMVSTPREVYE
jgi:hypothetical protein